MPLKLIGKSGFQNPYRKNLRATSCLGALVAKNNFATKAPRHEDSQRKPQNRNVLIAQYVKVQ